MPKLLSRDTPQEADRAAPSHLTFDGVSVAGRSHRLWRVLGVLIVAVAVPGAFATSQAAARSAPTPSTTKAVTTLNDTDPADCAAVMKALVVGTSCEMTAKEDLSGKRVEQADSLSGRVGIEITITCVSLGDGWWLCRMEVTEWIFPSDFRRAGA